MVPEDKINEFVGRARAALGENLESLILYGSAASGDYHPEFSDVNLLCLLRDASYEKLRTLSPIVKWWQRQNEPAPLIMTKDELLRSAEVFTIELLDMSQHRRVLWGNDPIQDLQIPMRRHRAQVEYELREKLILLRQQLLLAGNSERRIRELLVQSVTSFTTLFRHALITLGEGGQATRREVIKRLSSRAGFDPSAIEQVLDVREHEAKGSKLSAAEVLSGYLQAVERVTLAVDQAAK